MKLILALCFLGIALAFPFNGGVMPKWGNPDEWGPYFEGDIKFKDGDGRKQGKNGIIDEGHRWPNGQVAYAYDSSLADSKKSTIESAFQLYYDKTGGCIEWVPRTTEFDYVLFTGDDNDGCFSYVGKIGGQQQLNYPQWCIDEYGSVQHEQLHALGFYHEQSSPDRDTYVVIEWDNIQDGASGNFVKCGYSECTTFNTTYDYGSVMHYSKKAFTKNGLNTIVTIDPAYQNVIGQRDGVSDTDVQKLMLMYNCPKL